MLIEMRTVSAKTARDGRLELSADAAARLSAVASELALVAPAGAGLARITAMTCTCAKSGGQAHVHHFVESPLLRALEVGSNVRVELTGLVVHIAPAGSAAGNA
jgi:hypothetical protein